MPRFDEGEGRLDITLRGIEIGGFLLRFYSIMILLGLFAGIWLAQRQAKLYREDPAHAVNIAVLGAVLGIIGARLYHVFDQQEWPRYRDNPSDIFAIWNGGIGIFGAVAGSVLALWLYTRYVGESRRFSSLPFALPVIVRRRPALSTIRWLDIGAVAFLLGQAIGRWGNFFNQELFGKPTDLPWAITIPVEQVIIEAPVEYWGFTQFHPLFFYESALNFIGVAVILFLTRRAFGWLRRGDVLSMYLMWYPIVRFSLEFLRTDPWEQGGIPMAQIVSVLMFAGGAGSLIYRHLRAPPVDDEPAENDPQRSRSAERRRLRRAQARPGG